MRRRLPRVWLGGFTNLPLVTRWYYGNPLGAVKRSRGFSRIELPEISIPFRNQFGIVIGGKVVPNDSRLDKEELTQALKERLAADLQGQSEFIAEILSQIYTGKSSQTEIALSPEMIRAIQSLKGEIKFSDAAIVFGDGINAGDITMRDAVGRDIIKINQTFNQISLQVPPHSVRREETDVIEAPSNSKAISGSTDIIPSELALFFGLKSHQDTISIVIPSFPMEALQSKINSVISSLNNLLGNSSSVDNGHLTEIISKLEGLWTANLGKSTGTTKILKDIKHSALAQADLYAFADIRDLLSEKLPSSPQFPKPRPKIVFDNSTNPLESANVIIAIGLYSNEQAMSIFNHHNRLPFKLRKGNPGGNTIFFQHKRYRQHTDCNKKYDYALVVHIRSTDKSYIIIGGISPESTIEIGKYIRTEWQTIINYINRKTSKKPMPPVEFAILFEITFETNNVIAIKDCAFLY